MTYLICFIVLMYLLPFRYAATCGLIVAALLVLSLDIVTAGVASALIFIWVITKGMRNGKHKA